MVIKKSWTVLSSGLIFFKFSQKPAIIMVLTDRVAVIYGSANIINSSRVTWNNVFQISTLCVKDHMFLFLKNKKHECIKCDHKE